MMPRAELLRSRLSLIAARAERAESRVLELRQRITLGAFDRKGLSVCLAARIPDDRLDYAWVFCWRRAGH